MSSDQPLPAPGDILVPGGLWTEGSLRRYTDLDSSQLSWTKGPMGHTASIQGVVIGSVSRLTTKSPWIIRLHGYQWWLPPSSIAAYWHYSPVGAESRLPVAKAHLAKLFTARPLLATEG